MNAILVALFTAIGAVALKFLDKYIDREKAVNEAAVATEQDTKEIADAQAQNNATAGTTVGDVRRRLRARLDEIEARKQNH